MANLAASPLISIVVALAFAFSWASRLDAAPKKTEKVNLTDVKEYKRPKRQAPEKAQIRMSRNEAFIMATEHRLLKEINKAIAYLSKTAERMPKKSTARLEMREKLINLRLEAAVYHASQEMRRYDSAWESWDSGGRRGSEPKVDNSKSRLQWEILAKDAAVLLQEFPRSKNADTTMFNMGLAQNFLGREKEAARVFSQLISKYPNSQKAGDAYFALGDFYFERTDFRNAMNNYKNALRFKQSKAYAWSLFKLAWCYYNLGDYKGALGYWKQTVSASNRIGKKGLALKDEALRDMIYGFAETRQVEPAIAYYRRNGGHKYIGKFLLLLSQTFSDQGHYNAAITILKRFQQVEPYDEGAPDTQKEIISLNYELNRFSNVWGELGRFPQLFGPKSPWAAKNKSNKKLYLEVQQMIKDQILYYAKLTHKTAQKDDNRRAYAEAMRGYKLFLSSYPKSKEAAEVKYLMADIEYFTKNYSDAGKLYLEICLLGKDKAVIIDPKSNKGKNIHRESANYMLDAYLQNFEPELKVLVKQKADFKKPARPLSDRAKSFVKACGYYQRWYPDDKKNVKTCDIYITEVFYRTNNKKMSMKYLWLLAKKYPGTKEGNEAVDNLIPLYQNDKQALAKVASELLKIPAYSRGKTGAKLKALVNGIEIELAKSEKNRCKRAAKYEQLYKKNPKSSDAPALMFNSAEDYLACGKVGEAITAYLIVLKRFPKSEGSQPAMLQIAKLNERRLELGAAANYYEEYAKKYPKDQFAIGAIAKACELQAALDASGVVNTCLIFARADEKGAKLVFQRLLRAAFSARQSSRLTQYIGVYESKFRLSPEEKILAYSMVYNITNGRGEVGRQAQGKILATFQQSGGNVAGEALRAVGGLVFERVNGDMAKYEKINLKGGTVDALAASIQAKVGALTQIQGNYDQVLATKDAYWGVAALYQLGYARELLAKDLENPPVITGAKPEDVVKQLAGDAKGARQEARKFYLLALESVKKFDVYNEWAVKALSGLARITGKNVSFEDLIVTPDFLGAEVPESVGQAVSSGAGT